MSFFSDLWNGISDGFSHAGTGLRHIFTGYQPDKYPQDKAAQDELKKVSDSIDQKGFANTLLDGTPIAGIKNELDWVIIGVVGLLLYNFIFKD